VRYTIQQGLIGPGVRIALGALLAAALVAAVNGRAGRKHYPAFPASLRRTFQAC
jgi:uncharacterized membrane protein